MIDHAMQLVMYKGALLKDIVEFLNDTDRKSKHLMNGSMNWDKIMSTPGNL